MIASGEDRMRFAIDLSRRNVDARTGGPFGAAVFERNTGRLVGAGVNRVVPLRRSAAHAEILAIAEAEADELFEPSACELVSSAQPCLMCAGAAFWAGVSRVVYAARRADVELLAGFDEGPIPPGLETRGIEVCEADEELRRLACAVLARYRAEGGQIY
jgi:tRNA(Arg) A34 adenosine deaminase TadA